MLYSEFLRGTEMPESKEAYSFYEKVNALYMHNNLWDKEDAYIYACKLAKKRKSYTAISFYYSEYCNRGNIRRTYFFKKIFSML